MDIFEGKNGSTIDDYIAFGEISYYFVLNAINRNKEILLLHNNSPYMRLPKQISPLPLLQSAMEFRFESSMDLEEVLGKIYPVLITDFPVFTPNLTSPFEKNYLFRNDNYSIGVFDNIIVFDALQYKGWDNYLAHIIKYFEIVNNVFSINSFTRVGLRNINIFENKQDVNEILKNSIGIEFEGYKNKMQVHSHSFAKDNIVIFLQLAANANADSPSRKISKTGGYIDIESSCTVNLNINDFPKLFDILHLESKRLFFSLLKNDFIEELNPVY